MEPNRSTIRASPAEVEPDVSAVTVPAFGRTDALARRVACMVAIAALVGGAVRAQPADDRTAVGRVAEIGAVDFDADCGIGVVDRIDRALGLMHHMMYEPSRAVFAEVAEEEPSCAMAHWGVATTLIQPLSQERPTADMLQRGWAATERARAVVGSVREHRLVEATGAFFRDPESADDWTRIERWAAGMRDAYVSSPYDLDTAALYALSRIAIAPIADDRAALFAEAESVLQRVFIASPTHPGCVPCGIPAADVDGIAERAGRDAGRHARGTLGGSSPEAGSARP